MNLSASLLVLIAGAFAAALPCGVSAAADPNKVLRVASPDIDTLDPQQYSDNPSFEVLVAIFEPAVRMGLSRIAAEALAADRSGTDRVRRRRKALDPAHQAGNFFHRRPRFQRQAARAGGRRLRLLVQALARSQRPARRRAYHHRPDRRRAPCDRRRKKYRKVRLRPADRRPAGARSIHAAARAHRTELPQHPGHDRLRRRGCARGCRGGRRRHPHPRGGHRTVPAARMEARLAHRPRSKPGVSRRALSREQRSCARRAGEEHAGQDRAADRRRRDQHHRRGPYRACCNSSRAGSTTSCSGEISPPVCSPSDSVKPEYAARGITRRAYPEPYLFSF